MSSSGSREPSRRPARRRDQPATREDAHVAVPQPSFEAERGRLESEAIFEWEGYRGPTPPPALIEGYQRAIPHGGERVMELAESEVQHRHEMERDQLKKSYRAHLIGQAGG